MGIFGKIKDAIFGHKDPGPGNRPTIPAGMAGGPPAQAQPSLDMGTLTRLGGPDLAEPLYWQQWSIDSVSLTAIRESVVAHARAALAEA